MSSAHSAGREHHLDTSALGRMLLGEPDAQAILTTLGGFDQRVASRPISSPRRGSRAPIGSMRS